MVNVLGNNYRNVGLIICLGMVNQYVGKNTGGRCLLWEGHKETYKELITCLLANMPSSGGHQNANGSDGGIIRLDGNHLGRNNLGQLSRTQKDRD